MDEPVRANDREVDSEAQQHEAEGRQRACGGDLEILAR